MMCWIYECTSLHLLYKQDFHRNLKYSDLCINHTHIEGETDFKNISLCLKIMYFYSI